MQFNYKIFSKVKKEKNAIIIAHNYQKPEVQDIADFVGDSLELSKIANDSKASTIVFCGVRFMAETAKILSPEKTVLLPVKNAGCPMADQISKEEIEILRKNYPDAAFVAYVNTNADVKALVDICCTSSNAIKVVNSLKENQIVFIPDRNLAHWVSLHTDKEIVSYSGFCYVHQKFKISEIIKIKREHPDAEILVHPESPPEVVKEADFVLSTSGILKHVKKSNKNKFIIGTESGLIYRLRKENPYKNFYSLGTPKICFNMKKTSLNDVFSSLINNKHEITLSPEIIKEAKKPLERMVKI